METSVNATSIEEIEDAIHNALQDYSDAEMATIDEFLQEQDSEDDEVNIFMTSTARYGEESDEDIIVNGKQPNPED